MHECHAHLIWETASIQESDGIMVRLLTARCSVCRRRADAPAAAARIASSTTIATFMAAGQEQLQLKQLSEMQCGFA